MLKYREITPKKNSATQLHSMISINVIYYSTTENNSIIPHIDNSKNFATIPIEKNIPYNNILWLLVSIILKLIKIKMKSIKGNKKK